MSRFEIRNLDAHTTTVIEEYKKKWFLSTSSKVVIRIIRSFRSLENDNDDLKTQVSNLKQEIRYYEGVFEKIRHAKKVEKELNQIIYRDEN